jgi:hypothetical protein
MLGETTSVSPKDFSILTNNLFLLFNDAAVGNREYIESSGKGKIVSVHAIKACRGSRRLAPLILNFGARWKLEASITPRPLYLRGRTAVPM